MARSYGIRGQVIKAASLLVKSVLMKSKKTETLIHGAFRVKRPPYKRCVDGNIFDMKRELEEDD